MMEFDATYLYPSAMSDEKPIQPKLETGFAFKPHMENVHEEAFRTQTFDQDGNESAILIIKNYNPPDLIFQHLPNKEKVKNIEVNGMRRGYIIDTLTSVDIQGNFKIGGKVIEIYEGVFYQEVFQISPFRQIIDKFFALKQNIKMKVMIWCKVWLN